MKKYIDAAYIAEKLYPVEYLIKEVEDKLNSGNCCLTDTISEYRAQEIAYAFAVIAKELGVKIPDV